VNLGCRGARAALVEQFDDARGQIVDVGAGCVEHEVGVLGRLVGGIDTRHAGQLAAACTRIEAFGVTLFALGQRRGDVDLDEGRGRNRLRCIDLLVALPVTAH
jgi:hypothetical protein